MFSTPKNIKSTHRFWELSLDCFWVFVYRFLNVVPLVNDKPKYTIYSYSKVPQTWNSCSTKFPVLKSHIQHHFLEDDEVLKSHIQHHLQYPKYFVVILAAKKSPCPSTRSKQPPAYSMVVGSFPKFRATSWISNCLSWFTLIFPESNKGINFRKNMLCSRSIHFFPPPSQKKKDKKPTDFLSLPFNKNKKHETQLTSRFLTSQPHLLQSFQQLWQCRFLPWHQRKMPGATEPVGPPNKGLLRVGFLSSEKIRAAKKMAKP